MVIKLKYKLQIWKIMRLVFLPVFIMLSLSGISYARNAVSQDVLHKTASISVKNKTVKSVLNALEKQTGVIFIYSPELINADRKINLEANEETIDEILKHIFTRGLIHPEIRQKQIILVKNSESTLPLIEIKGTVTDLQGQPLIGVTVQVKGGSSGTTTDASGGFVLDVPSDAVLEFSYIGYQTMDVQLGGKKTLSIQMQPSASSLNEVVVVGYGTQKKADITGSIATVDQKVLKNRPITSSSQALQGASGLYVNQGNGGQPGADAATIRIRGVGTLNDNDPLVLVDGVPYSLRDVNPNDIESISVLKDAAAAAIYGNRAANGVILIKTKSGKEGKMQLNYNDYFGFQQPTYLPNTINNSYEFATLYNQALANEGSNPSFTQAEIDSFKVHQGHDSPIYSNTDWDNVMFKNAFIQQHDLRFSGGSDKALYSISLGYLDQDGVLIGTSAKRYSLAANLSFNVTDHLKVGLNLNGVNWNKKQSPLGISGLMNLTYRTLPFQVPTLANGQYADQWFVLKGQGVFRNPYALALEGTGKNTTTNILANFYAEYQLPFNIKYKVNYGITKEDDYTNNFIPNIYMYNPITGAASLLDWLGMPRSAERNNNNVLNTDFYETFNWRYTIARNHNLNVLIGNSIEDYNNASYRGYVEGFIDNQVTELSNGTVNQAVGSSSSENKLLSYFGRAGYNYKEKYLAEFDFRYDGSSRFTPSHRWGFFPSGSLGWRIDKESFFQPLKNTVSSLKLRASWGQLGNQNIPDFAYQNTYANTVPLGYSFGSNVQVGAAATQLSNPDISWERTTTMDIGLDAGFWDEKLSLTADYFNRKTTGILTPVIIPSQIGDLTGPERNLYSMKNYGYEVNIDYQNTIGQLSYNLAGNVSYTQNKVISLDGQEQISGNFITKEGYPVNSFYLLKATGIFQSQKEVDDHAYEGPHTQPGDIIYADINEDSVVDNNDREIAGRSIPLYTYSFNLGMSYHGFDLSAFFQGVADVNTYSIANLSQPFYNGAGITKEWATDSWTTDRPNATLPRLTTERGYPQNFENSTFWLKDASYLRLKNIQIGYTLPKKLFEGTGINELKIFINGQNLLTFSKFKLVDPERVTTLNTIYSYPSVKMYTAGINLTF